MIKVLAQAIVDELPSEETGENPRFIVTVTGQPPFDYRRVYTILAETDTFAAQEGIARFVAEMERIHAFGPG